MKNYYKIFLQLLIFCVSINITLNAQNLFPEPEKQLGIVHQNNQESATGYEFGTNELFMASDSGRSGYPISISYTINNTDQFVSFQFDIILPSVLTFVEDSVWLFRKSNQTLIFTLLIA